jgi:hypothetical protein
MTKNQAVTGYMHPQYAQSLTEFGIPRELPRCRGWILQRQIPDFSYYDGMGCYPLFVCQDWAQLLVDLEDIESELVSLALVADPFGGYDLSCLRQGFDKVIPFKDHFIVDPCYPINDLVSKHHRYYARRALRNVFVERHPDPAQFIDEWVALYATLIEKRNITGIRAFSRAAFAKQLRVPGIVVFRATYQDSTIGAHLWYVQGEVAYSHLEAVSPIGYKLMASYALYWYALSWFSKGVRWLDIGAGAGTKGTGTDGLSQFKRGWSTGTRTAYLCGRIFDREKYAQIVDAKDIYATDYFPAYRQGEFG